MHPDLTPSPMRDPRNLTIAFFAAAAAMIVLLLAAGTSINLIGW